MRRKHLPKYIRDIRKLIENGKSGEEARYIVLRKTGYGIDLTGEKYDRIIEEYDPVQYPPTKSEIHMRKNR